jgi:pyrimidine-specific ribonucleoside hydrolase
MTEILLDVDTGVDDALALLFAIRHPGLTVRGISCVTGNTHVDQVVRNTLRVLDAAGAGDVPVARGADRPLLEPPRDAHEVHGPDGLAGLELPASDRQPVAEHAVELLRRQILAAAEPITLITLAPLTNIALLVRTHPEVVERIGRIVAMAGSAGTGNASATAEFNVWHDPEAAAIVFGCGAPLLMYGLDVFYRPAVSRPDADRLAGSADPGARLAGLLLRHAAETYGGDLRMPQRGAAGLGDAGAVCAVADPDGLRTERLPVHVELAVGTARGQTVVDRRNLPGDAEFHGQGPIGPPVDVALDLDGARYSALFLDTVTAAVA